MAGLEPAPTVLCHGRPRPRLYQLSYTNIEAYAKAVISTAIHPCHFRQSVRFDVGPGHSRGPGYGTCLNPRLCCPSLRVRPALAVIRFMFHARVRSPFRVADEELLLVVGLEPAPTMLCHGRPRPRLYQLSYTNIEAVRS